MILIKMDMPESCYLCPFMDGEYLVCNVPGKVEKTGEMVGVNYRNHRHEDCPLMSFGEYPKTPNPHIFYVVEHEGQHNPITQSFTNIKEAEDYFNKNLGATPILYEVTPIEWVDRTGTKHETYN